MKASLTQDGTLTITPESELEAYALAAWSAARTKRGDGKSALVVETAYKPGFYIPSTGAITVTDPRIYTGSTGQWTGNLNPTITGIDTTNGAAGTCP